MEQQKQNPRVKRTLEQIKTAFKELILREKGLSGLDL